MAKKKWPKTLIVHRVGDTTTDDEFLAAVETPEDIAEEYADDPVAVYELIAVGKFSVEKQVDAKPVKKLKVGRPSK